MTWEWVVLISVLSVVAVAVYLHRDQKSQMSDVSLELLKEQIAKLNADHESVHKLAEETKKLLSQQNLAASFKVRG